MLVALLTEIELTAKSGGAGTGGIEEQSVRRALTDSGKRNCRL